MRKFLILTAALTALATSASAFPHSSPPMSSPPVTTTLTRTVGPDTVKVTSTKQDTAAGKTLDKTKTVSRNGSVFRTVNEHCETPTGSHMPVCN